MFDTQRHIFSNDLGTLNGINTRAKVRESATQKCCKALAIFYALRPKVDKEIGSLIRS